MCNMDAVCSCIWSTATFPADTDHDTCWVCAYWTPPLHVVHTGYKQFHKFVKVFVGNQTYFVKHHEMSQCTQVSPYIQTCSLQSWLNTGSWFLLLNRFHQVSSKIYWESEIYESLKVLAEMPTWYTVSFDIVLTQIVY